MVHESGWDNMPISSMICSAFFLPHVQEGGAVLVALYLLSKTMIVFRPDCISKTEEWADENVGKCLKRSL